MMKDFSPLIELALTCPPPSPISDNEFLIGFGHDALDEYFNQIVESIHSGDIKRFIVMAGCDGRQKIRSYYSDTAMFLPRDTIILTAGCAKYRYNSFSLGEINGIPRLIDAGQCNDSYSLAVFALKLKEAFEVDDINKLPISFDIAWYEQKAVAVLLALLSLGFRNIRLGPSLPAFVSPKILKFLVKNYKLKPITSVHEDIEMMMHGK
jgi:hydroxylamine reductase